CPEPERQGRASRRTAARELLCALFCRACLRREGVAHIWSIVSDLASRTAVFLVVCSDCVDCCRFVSQACVCIQVPDRLHATYYFAGGDRDSVNQAEMDSRGCSRCCRLYGSRCIASLLSVSLSQS